MTEKRAAMNQRPNKKKSYNSYSMKITKLKRFLKMTINLRHLNMISFSIRRKMFWILSISY